MRILEDWLYVEGMDSEVTYGFTLNTDDGLLNSPYLWFGVATLNEMDGPTPPAPMADPITVSPITKEPLAVP